MERSVVDATALSPADWTDIFRSNQNELETEGDVRNLLFAGPVISSSVTLRLTSGKQATPNTPPHPDPAT